MNSTEMRFLRRIKTRLDRIKIETRLDRIRNEIYRDDELKEESIEVTTQDG